ncbi:MAG: hypothetical protein KC501_07875 [Myxococcales bacterium]|nr:hypothetical protein [Myxococcales bacterium]
MADVETIVEPEVSLHMDATFFPVLCVTWFGVISPTTVTGYMNWLDRMATRAAEEGTRVSILGDITGLESRPGPEIRRSMAKAIDELATRHGRTLMGGVTIIADPFMRAILSMVVAISRREFELKPVRTFAQAVERTFALLDAEGIARPEGLEQRTRPERPQ